MVVRLNPTQPGPARLGSYKLSIINFPSHPPVPSSIHPVLICQQTTNLIWSSARAESWWSEPSPQYLVSCCCCFMIINYQDDFLVLTFAGRVVSLDLAEDDLDYKNPPVPAITWRRTWVDSVTTGTATTSSQTTLSARQDGGKIVN